MGLTTGIGWTDATWSPWFGCTKVSAGCKNCYAEVETPVRIARAHGTELWGLNGQRQAMSERHWQVPVRWDKWATEGRCLACNGRGWSYQSLPDDSSGSSLTVKSAVDCGQCNTTGKVAPYWLKVFPSMCDPFEDRPDLIDPRHRFLQLIEATPNLDWLLLTKRPEKVGDMVPVKWSATGWPSNLWLGTSVEDQENANKRIPELLKLPARMRFLSCEPLLSEIEFSDVTRRSDYVTALGKPALSGIGWVIIGGESGTGRRECELSAITSLAKQCTIAGVLVFVKQDAALKPGHQGRIPDDVWALKQVPQSPASTLATVGGIQ